MGCCRDIFRKSGSPNRAVICLKWVRPIQLFILASVFVSVVYSLTHADRLTPRTIIILLIHLILVLVLSSECRRSTRYHQQINKDK